jgi:mono/diheme cytochrome c family protein
MTEPITTPNDPQQPPVVAGAVAAFDGPEALRAAAARVRDAGFARWDAHSPFAVHGMEGAMGIRATPLPWIALGGGILGAAGALLMQWWMNAINYPIVTSGKPLFSLPANIPITFELLVLLSALGAFGSVLVLNLLPQFWHWVFAGRAFQRATTNGFFISIEATDAKFDAAETPKFLESLRPLAVELCYDTAVRRELPSAVYWSVAVLVVLSLIPPLLIARYRAVPKSLPRIHPILDMDLQPKYLPQGASPLFSDGRAMRPPVPGTVAQGQLDSGWGGSSTATPTVNGKWVAAFPVPVTPSLMERGQERFNVYCAVCHGLMGDGGASSVTSARAIRREDKGWVPPLSLHGPTIRQQPVGELFNTVTNGIRTMPAYASQIPPADRWAIVLYVRALQRSQNATIKDVPDDFRRQLR